MATREIEFALCFVNKKLQRKAVVAVLALAGAAFCVDRFVLGYGPRAASADTITAIITPAAAAPDSEAASLPTSTLTRKVGDLAAGHSPTDFPDALRLPAEWAPLLAEPKTPDVVPVAPLKEAPLAEPSFVVSSVFLGASPTTTGARINNKIILINQSISGYKLLDIQKGNPSIVILSGPRGELRVPLTIGGTNTVAGADEPAPAPHKE